MFPQNIKNLNSSKSSLLLVTSFSAILVLVFIVLALILYQINSTNARVNEIVTSNNEKAQLLATMQRAARERSLTLYRMVSQKDIFDRDETYIEFVGYAQSFIKARQAFLAMPLSETEKKLIASQGKLSNFSVPIQNKITDLLIDEHFDNAANLLNTKSIPAQNAVLTEITKLINYQNINNKKIIQKLDDNLGSQIFIISITGIIVFLLATSIAFWGTKYILKTEKNLFIEKELAQTTLKSIGDGVITISKDYIIQTINPVAEILAGVKSKEVLGENILTLYQGKGGADKAKINETLTTPQRSLFDLSLTQIDGSDHEIEHTIAPIIDSDKNIQGAVIILRDVTEMRSLAKRLSYQASHDALTGLINRREFEVRLTQTIRNAQSEHVTHSICFLDLDKFKIINDTSGHAAGDEFLKQISTTIHSLLRKTDVLARVGGDEFAIILDSCSIARAKNICNQIIKTIKDTRFSWGNNSFESGASIGIVPITQHTASVQEVMSSVDAACYEAKDKGRNRIQVFEPNDAEFVRHQKETSWIQRIKNAINNNSFELYYQDIINIEENYSAPRTIEILIRLNDKGTLILPDSFLPTAERYHMMPLIDEWVISKTFEFIENYKKKNKSEIRVAINLSGQSLSEDSVLNLIVSTLRKNKTLKKDLICFEITETAAIANMSRAIEFISTVKQMGCKFSLDDFGSGLSSFSYLKNMPVDNLKIDGIFIRDINTDPINKVFVESIHNIGKVMGIKTTAEYVENEDILNSIKEIGIDYAQGHFISIPAPIKNLL